MNILDPAWSRNHFPFFVPLTTPSPDRLFAPPQLISNLTFVAIYFPALVVSYALLLSPFPKTTGAKQVLVTPFLLYLFFLPLLFTCPTKVLHLCLSVVSAGCLTRLVDIYYVQPWTGIPSRYYLRILMAEASTDAVARSKKDLDQKQDQKDAIGQEKQPSSPQAMIGALSQKLKHNQFEPLTWTSARFRSEMLSPLRNYTSILPSTRSSNSKQLGWRDLLPRMLIYDFILEILLFATSFYTPEDVNQMNALMFWIFAACVAVIMIVNILQQYYVAAMAWSWYTGNTLDTSDWSVLGNHVPFFATTPVEFWNNWHTLFRYVWVDLGFLPMQRLCKQYLRPDVVGSTVSSAVRQILPVMSVFALSGIMHGYIIYSSMEEPFWGQFVFFLIHGSAVVLTKAVGQTPIGRWIERMSVEGGATTRLLLKIIGVVSMYALHITTFPLFMNPYVKHGLWVGMKPRSLLWWIFGK